MITEKDIVDQLINNVTERVSNVIQQSLSDIVQTEISKALNKALMEGQFYRSVNTDVIDGIGNIYSEIKAVKKSLVGSVPGESVYLLHQSDSILDGIIKATESATLKILDHLENLQEQINDVKRLIETEDKAAARSKLDNLDGIILDTMTELSFQDLTGQQIRRVVQSLKKVEEIVFDVYVTSEVLKKSKELSPDKDIDQIREETRDLIDSVKHEKQRIDQNGVDSLLEELGM